MSQLSDLQKELDELKLLVHKLKETHQPLVEEVKVKRHETDEAYRIYVTKSREKRDAEEKLAITKRQLDDFNAQLLEKERLLIKEMLKQEEDEKRAAQFAKMDDLVSTGKWREWAFDYQIEGAKILALEGRGFLGDKRGSGKTLTSNIWLHLLGAKKVLVVAPKDVVSEFEEEVRKWTIGKTIVRLSGKNMTQREMLTIMLQDLDEFMVTINYSAWRKDPGLVDSLIALGFDTVICDEAHEINTLSTVQAQGVVRIVYTPYKCPSCSVTFKEMEHSDYLHRWSCNNCEDSWSDRNPKLYNVKHFLGMSGTHMLNHPKELFTCLYLIDRDAFPSEKEYLQTYCYRSSGKWRFMPGSQQLIMNRLAGRYLVRKPEHGPPPAIHYPKLDFDGYEIQGKRYKELASAAAIRLESDDKILSIPEMIVLIMRLRQMTSWPQGIILKHKDENGKEIIDFQCDVKESVKADYAEKLARQLVDEGDRVLIFSTFKPILIELQRRLGESCVRYDGDTSDALKEAIKADFKPNVENPRWNICVANSKSGGVGLNLQGANHEIILDRSWNPGREDQTIGRVDRIGQSKQVNVYIPQIEGTIDNWLDDLIEGKRALVEQFEGTAKETQQSLLKALKDLL